MHTLAELQRIVDERIETLEMPDFPVELYEPIRYTLGLGGKRLRPALCLMGADMVGGHALDALDPAIGIEVFHNFTLIHDDIMDEAPLRRNKPTVYKKWNSTIAILSGDVMFAMAGKLISEAPAQVLKEVLDVYHKNAIHVCEGQQIDMNFEGLDDVQLDEYEQMIRLKTAVLLGAALQIGALCGGGSSETAKTIYEAGCLLGLAFQLQDDVLDVFGDPDKFGKLPGGDILCNKKTWLPLRARQKANPEELNELQHWYSGKGFNPDEKVKAVTSLFNRLNIREDAIAEMERYFQRAMTLLDETAIPQERLAPLKAFASQLLVREV